MLVAIINFLILLLILGLLYAVVIWVLGLLGVAIPTRIMQIVGAIIFLVVLLWFLQAIIGGGHFPRLLLIMGRL